jgi:hypothetical protein
LKAAMEQYRPADSKAVQASHPLLQHPAFIPASFGGNPVEEGMSRKKRA